nr:probable carbohydrate esterase At4g34215 [Ipomoea trifida]
MGENCSYSFSHAYIPIPLLNWLNNGKDVQERGGSSNASSKKKGRVIKTNNDWVGVAEEFMKQDKGFESNMVIDKHNESVWNHVTPPECLPNPSILRFASNNSWVPVEEPLHADIDVTKAKVCEVGPGIAFANHLLKRDPEVGVIGLVPCAIGGTTLNEWLPAAKAYYNQMLVRTYGAMRASNNGGQIRALLWYQGESEAKGKDYPSPFASNLEIFFNSVRHDFGLPALPIIQVALPSATDDSYVKDIRKFQLELKLPMLSTVDANGSQLQNDSVHLTSTAQVHLGIAMANAFLQISHS